MTAEEITLIADELFAAELLVTTLTPVEAIRRAVDGYLAEHTPQEAAAYVAWMYGEDPAEAPTHMRCCLEAAVRVWGPPEVTT